MLYYIESKCRVTFLNEFSSEKILVSLHCRCFIDYIIIYTKVGHG